MSTTATRPAKVKICEFCGNPYQVEELPATDRRTGRAVTLYLCKLCREGRNRTWRLRYEAHQ